ncbi:hypothetical protein [Nocardioides sp.]|uniref:hypothetical protein n=1 Tax=Nocardioides sp. TaxID=35761 RepID=UPI0039E3E2BF
MRRRVVLGWLALLLLLAGSAGAAWWRSSQHSGLATALALAPADAQRYAWTDWAAVRQRLGESSLDRLLAKGYDADLTSASAMGTSAAALRDTLGFSPASVSWELLAQSSSGVVDLIGLPDPKAVHRAIEEAGWRPMEDPLRDDMWGDVNGGALTTKLGIAPEFSYLAIRDGVLFASDDAAYLASVLDADDSPAEPIAAVVSAIGDPLSALVYGGDYACGHLAMSQADDVDQAQAAALLREVDGVDPMTAFAMAAEPGGAVRVAMAFEGHARAVHNADARASLASGSAPGQGGDFSERFALGKVEASGDLVTMELRPTNGAAVLSDLTNGPVLFASC